MSYMLARQAQFTFQRIDASLGRTGGARCAIGATVMNNGCQRHVDTSKHGQLYALSETVDSAGLLPLTPIYISIAETAVHVPDHALTWQVVGFCSALEEIELVQNPHNACETSEAVPAAMAA